MNEWVCACSTVTSGVTGGWVVFKMIQVRPSSPTRARPNCPNLVVTNCPSLRPFWRKNGLEDNGNRGKTLEMFMMHRVSGAHVGRKPWDKTHTHTHTHAVARPHT